jgi:hypothetical protein
VNLGWGLRWLVLSTVLAAIGGAATAGIGHFRHGTDRARNGVRPRFGAFRGVRGQRRRMEADRHGPKAADGEDTYVLCEINASSTFAFPEFAMPEVARAALARIEAHRAVL